MQKRQDRMGHAIHQFKALFWKNWLCRVRQPVLSLSEILWPCVLFFILAAIRFQEPPKYKENCYLEARDLPSRGLYPFVRTLFCNVGSRCRNTSYTIQKNNRLRTSGFQGGPESFIGPDLAFMKEIQDLAKGFIETTEKVMALEKLWEEDSKFSGLHNSTTFLTMDLNEAEEMISGIENLYKQPHFWDLLHSLPQLKLSSFYTKDGLEAIAQFLEAIKNTLASLEDLTVMPLGQSFYEVVKITLNLTAASVRFLQDRSLEGFRYNLSLWDVLWDPHAVRVELKSRFGFDDLRVKKLLSYTSQLPEIPTEETLEQFVCSALSSVPGDEANGENDEGCISACHETKLYLVHSVSKLRLYSQVFHQWFSSNRSQKHLSELEGMIADLMSQFLDGNEARKIVSGISTLILQWNEKSEVSFSEGHSASRVLILYLERMQAALQAVPQWPATKRLLLIDGAIRNVVTQNSYFIEEVLRNLEKLIPFTRRDGLIHLDIEKLFVELKRMLLRNASCVCNDVLTMFEKALRLPQGSDGVDVSAVYVCPNNDSEIILKLSNQVQSLKESKVIQGRQSIPDSRMDDFLGWQEIEEQLTESYAYYCEIDQLLSPWMPSAAEDVRFGSCQEQLFFSLINNTLEEIWFVFEEDPYWKDLTTFVRWLCEVAQYVNEEVGSTDGLEVALCSGQKLRLRTILSFAEILKNDLSDYSPFTSWARILTSVKELLKREENLWISGEKEITHLLNLTEFIEEITIPDFSAPSNLQSLTETILNNSITWMNSFAEREESSTDFSPAVSELRNELLKNFQLLQRFWQKEKMAFFWQTVKMVCYELFSRLSWLSQMEEVEVLETLSRTIFSIPENEKILNRSMLLLQNNLANQSGLNIVDVSYLKHFNEDLIRNLREVGSMTEGHVNTTFHTIHGVSNASSSLLSNATFIYKVQKLGEIVSDFFKDIQKLNSGSMASLVQILFSVYQNIDLLLNTESNSALLTLLYETSKDILSFQAWHGFQDRDKVFDLLSETFNLLWNFSGKPLCEKLLTIYNYTEFQAQSLAQKDKEMQVVYNTLSSLKSLFMDKELQTAASCYLEEFFGVSAECVGNNRCIGFYLSNATSVENSAEVYDFLLLPFDSVLSNLTKLGDEINVASALHCTFIWLQTWTEVFEEVSKILSLNSTFFVSLRYGLANVSERFLNTTRAEVCNKTTMLIVEATTAMHLLKSMVEGGDLNDWKDFEALLSNFQSVINNAVDVTSLLAGNSSEEVLEIMGAAITDFQRSVLKAVNGGVLNSWLDAFISGRSEGEDRDANLYSIGNALSTILRLSKKELGIVLMEIKDTSTFLRSISQDKYLVCIRIFQNIARLILDHVLKDKSHSPINLSSHLNSLLNFSTLGEAEDCSRWVHILSNLSEKYKSLSHLESAKHTLFLLKSLGNIETDAKLRSMMDFINLIFNLVFPECSLSSSHILCANVYFNIITKTLKFVLPEFFGKDDVRVLDFIFTLVNNSGGQIPMLVNNLAEHLQYTSDRTHFIQSIHGSNRNSSVLLNPFRHLQLFLTEFLAEIQTLLENKTDIQQNSSSPLNTEFEAFLHEKNIHLLVQFFQHMISYLDSKLPRKLQGEYSTVLQALIKTAALNVELLKKVFRTLKSSTLIDFPIGSDKEFLKHVVALVQHLENTDVEFLIGQFKQVQGSLDYLFKNIKSLYIENSKLGMLPDWWDALENNLCNWNLTGFTQLAQLLQQDELSDVAEMFHLLLDVISLTEGLAHGNITEALTDVYTFIMAQVAKIPKFTKEELSDQVESLLMLLEALSDMPDEPAEASVCFSAVFCWTFTTAAPQSDPAFKLCDFDVHSNFSLAYNGVINIIKQLKLIPLEDSFSCTKEDFRTDITRNLTCFFHQIKEWNSLLLKFSELRHLNGSVLKELLDFWNELSTYAIPLQANITDSITCSSTLKVEAALQLVETLDGVTATEMEAAKAILEQLNDFYGALNLSGDTKTSLIKTVLSNFKNVTNEMSGLLDTEAILSFFSVVQPLITLSPVGNQAYSVLMALSALNRNGNISDNFENFWFRVETSIENLLVNFNVRHLRMVVEQGFQILRVATGQSSPMDLDGSIQQFNASSVDAMLRNFEDIQETVDSFLCECNTKNYSKIMHILISLMANEESSDDLLMVIKDIIDFLELFQNESKKGYIPMFFDDDLNRENMTNTHIADSVLQNSLLHMITDIAIIEAALHSNNTELHIDDVIDSFFDGAQHGSHGKAAHLFQNRTLEIMQEVLQMIFPSSTEHDRNRIVFLLKYLHEDIMAEMRASKMCHILQKHLPPANVLLLQKLQLTILNVLKIFSEEPAIISNFFCVVTRCKDGLTSHFLLSVIEGIILAQDHYEGIARTWSALNKGDCQHMAYINQQFFNTLESFLRALQNTTDGSCECRLLLENIQRHLQTLAENLEPLLSENPVVAFLSNFNLLNGMKVKDCIQNSTKLGLDIRSSINISEETLRTVLEASISHSKLFYSAFAAALAGRCDEEVFSLLLTLPENSKTSLVVEELCSLPALDLYAMFVLIIQNLNLRHIIYKVKIPSEIGSLLNMLLDVVSSISSLLSKAQHVMENLPVFLQAVKNIGVLDISALQQFLQGGQFRRSAVGSLESVIKAVCKEESSFFSNANMFIDMPRITELLEDDMAKYGIPEDSTPFCLKLYQEILQSSNGALVWTFLKPLLHGKILYNSNINMIDLVIEKANFTFAFVENLKTYSQMWLRMSEVFKNNGKGLMVSRLQEALQNNFIKRFVESHLNIDMGKLIEKMQVYETTMDKMLNSSATKQIDLLSQFLVNISSCVLLDRFQPFESVEKLEEKAHELMQQNNFLASIIFNVPNKTQDSRNLPRHISYTIRTSVLYSMRTDLIKNPTWKSHPQNLPADGFKYNHLFVPLQDMIEKAIILVHTGMDTSEPAIQVQAMPYPCHTSDLFLNNIGFFFPLMMMLTWMVSVAGMVRKLVYEREIHLEEYMKTMGVHPAIHFFAWFLENVIVLTISSCALVIILKASGIFAYSNSFLIFLFLLDFGVAVIMFSYLLGAFFRSANTAALCASLVYMISFLPYIVLLVLQNQLSFTNQIVTCLLSTTAFGQGIFFITFFEGQEIGIQWNNMYQPIARGGYMTFGWTCWMMFFDSIMYTVGGWYFSNIIPDPAPPGWKGASTEGAAVGVVLLSLTKEHADGQQAAVKDLSLAFHQGQITALLGPNGAGKTTVISLLTGLYPPSSGTIIINGKDIRTDLAAIRTELGVCPQYDVLFDTLTVREHLLLYGSVKAPVWTKKQLTQHVSVALEDVDLSQHQYKPVGALSGGMKRRLSIAISFIGNSKTVVLDEPTSGVDPCSRRSIWDIILKYKAGCTLIFTTHHLDEAEVLSDRVAILQRGQLRCCGSPSYLRETYGQGHSLTLIKKPSVFEIQDPKHIVQVTSLVQTHIPEAFLKENNGTELTYMIPERVDKTSFKGLFHALDENLHHLHVTGYGISDTTLEEVFLKLLQDSEKMPCVPQAAHLDHADGVESACEILARLKFVGGLLRLLSEFLQPVPGGLFQNALNSGLRVLLGKAIEWVGWQTKWLCTKIHLQYKAGDHLFKSPVSEKQVTSGKYLSEPDISLTGASSVHGASLVFTQIVALLMKKFHHSRRDWRGSLSNVLLPVLFVAMAMALFSVKPLAIDYPSLKLTPGLYENTESFFSAEDDSLGDLSHILLRHFSDVDHACMRSKQGKNNSCWQMESTSHQYSCGCVAEQEMCPSFNISAPYVKNKKGHILYNLSGFRVEEYLVRPSNRPRYGGWSFGEKKAFELQDLKLNNTKYKPLAKVWYNQKGFHSLPSYLNELNNFILWLNLPPTADWRQYGITLYSQPYGGAFLDEDKIMENVRQCGVALCIMLGFSILTASIGSAIVKDRVSGTKRLQHITGLGYKAYWLANFFCDMLFYMVPVTLCVGVITAFQLSAFTFRENLAATVLLLILFGYATLPWMYLVSRFFSSSDVAFISYISLNFVFGLCTMLVTLLPRLLAIISKVQSFQNIYEILKWAFIIFPQFCLGQGLIELSYNQIKFDLTSSFGIDSYVSPFEMNFLGWIFVEMALQGTVLLLLRIFLHWDLLWKTRGQCSVSSMVNTSEDTDVEMERQRLFGGRTSNDILLLYNLRKCYGGFSKKNAAVENISLGIPRGECFGLLGTNGAGKSTTFKMLTGDIIPSAGRAVIRTPTGSEMDILSASSEGVLIGYCPQQDALDELLTGWEHLHYYCTLRGIPKQHIHKVAGDLVNRLQLNAHVDKLVRTYSCGTKRKLSTAVALVGKPQILLLDEPSSGMDPCSKRYLWKTILKEVQDGCAAVLTSHSMEECEALCTRLAIMVNGSFKCLGSPQHIKNRFGDGYSVKVWLSKEINDQRVILDCLQLHFPGTHFKGQRLNLLEYHVPRSQGCLAELFRVLENHKAFLQIKHYSISQTTLEQVFINFATQQQEVLHSAQESPTVLHDHLPV